MLKLWVLAIVFPIIEVLTKPEILTPRRCSRNGPNKFRVEFPNQVRRNGYFITVGVTNLV